MILIPILQAKKRRPKKIRGPPSVDGDSHQHLGHIFLRDESLPRPTRLGCKEGSRRRGRV